MHPEAYGVAKKIVASCGRDLRALMGDSAALKAIDPRAFVDEHFGLPTVRDIIAELEKPGRDPRPEFRTATFADGVEEMSDLRPGMLLEGTVTNVAAFGAFVDIGVHQDGLVHVSQLADRFVKDPHEVVKAGDVVKVRVVEVDVKRKRISPYHAQGRWRSGARERRQAAARSGARTDVEPSPGEGQGQAGQRRHGRVRRRAVRCNAAQIALHNHAANRTPLRSSRDDLCWAANWKWTAYDRNGQSPAGEMAGALRSAALRQHPH